MPTVTTSDRQEPYLDQLEDQVLSPLQRVLLSISTIVVFLGFGLLRFGRQATLMVIGAILIGAGFLVGLPILTIMSQRARTAYQRQTNRALSALGLQIVSPGDQQTWSAQAQLTLPNYTITTSQLWTGIYHGRTYAYGLAHAQGHQGRDTEKHSTDFAFLYTELTRPVGGRCLIWPHGHELWLVKTTYETESEEFNKQFGVNVEPESLSTEVLSPDFMSWLLDAPTPFAILIDQKQCWLMTETRPSPSQVPDLFVRAERIVKQCLDIDSAA